MKVSKQISRLHWNEELLTSVGHGYFSII